MLAGSGEVDLAVDDHDELGFGAVLVPNLGAGRHGDLGAEVVDGSDLVWGAFGEQVKQRELSVLGETGAHRMLHRVFFD